MFQHIEFKVADGIGHITLNRPDVGNALNLELVKELAAAAIACDYDATVKVVLLSARGRMFCTGGDLKAFSGFGDATSVRLKELADELHRRSQCSLACPLLSSSLSTARRQAPDLVSQYPLTMSLLQMWRSSRWPIRLQVSARMAAQLTFFHTLWGCFERKISL
jgi:hypothetical protein